MMARRQKCKHIALISITVCVLLAATAVYIDRRARVLNVPIRLTSGFRVESVFRVPRKADYRISVYCSSSADKSYLRKLLQGGNLIKVVVRGDGVLVPLYLFPEPLFRPGIVSTAEWGNIVFGQKEAGQDIADFTGDPATHYRISSSVIRPVPELDQMHPTVRVELDPLDLKGDLMLVALLAALSIASAAIALAATIACVIIRSRPNQAMELTASRRTA
jgi:hypothetical protein